MGCLITCTLVVMVCNFCVITAVDFTMADCNNGDGVFGQGSYSIFRTSATQWTPCRAVSNLYLPFDVEYMIEVDFRANKTATPGIIFNIIDDENYDLIYFRFDSTHCFNIESVVNNIFNLMTDRTYCGGFILEPNRQFNVKLHIKGTTLSLNLGDGGFEEEFRVLRHTQTPSTGLTNAHRHIHECYPNCEFKFEGLDLRPATEIHRFSAENGTLRTPNNGNNQLSLLRLEFLPTRLPGTYCFVTLIYTEIDVGPATIYIQGDTDHEEGEFKIYNTKEANLDIFFYSSTMESSHKGFTIEYHVFGCGLEEPDLSFICEDGHHFNRHNDFYRSVEHTSEPGNYHSDHTLPFGWYNFSSCAGEAMPTVSPERTQICGTRDPIWMKPKPNNNLQPKEDGYVEGTACVYSDGHQCSSNWTLPSFNCDNGLQLYYFIPTPQLSGYCIGSKIKCNPDENLTSIDGSGCSPCVEADFPSMNEPIIGEWTNRSGGVYDLACAIRPDASEGLEMEFEVKWYIVYPTGPYEIFHIDLTTQREVFLELTVLKHEYLQNNVICETREKYVQDQLFGPWVESEPKYIGLQVLTGDTDLEIGADGVAIQFAFTVPISCDGESCMNESDDKCFVDVFSLTSTRDMRQQPCHNILYFEHEILTWHTCSVRINCSNWRNPESVYIQVKDTKQVGLQAHTHTLYAISKNKNRRMWNNLVDDIKLNVKPDDDEAIGGASKTTCKSHNDPHLTTFAGTKYDVHDHEEEEEYVLYKSEPKVEQDMTSLVTATYGSCNMDRDKTLMCNLKVGVQVKDEAVVYDPRASRNGQLPLKYMGPGYGEMGFQIESLDNSEKYVFRLPRGERIISMVEKRKEGTFLEIDVESPLEEQTRTVGNGLCGEIRANAEKCKDLVLRNGHQYPTCPGNTEKVPDFSGNWTAIDEERIICDGIPIVDSASSFPTYSCSVYDINDFISSDEEWNFRRALLIEHCHPYSGNNLMDTLRRQTNQHKRQQSHNIRFTNKKTNTIPQKSIQSTWTDKAALQYCQNYIGLSIVARTCNVTNADDVANAIEECAADIVLTGETVWAHGTLSSLREVCILSVYKNVSLWEWEELGNDTILKPPAELTENLCPNDCSGHGDCIDGHCQCLEGYIKHDCSHDITIAPTVEGIYDNGICYLDNCNNITILGSDMIDSDNFTCHFMHEQKDKTTSGLLSNFDTVICPLPDIMTTLKGYTQFAVSLSNDGLLQSESVEAVVVTSECVSCFVADTDDIQCVVETNYCLIEGHCVNEGEYDVDDECWYCNPQELQDMWTSNCGSDNTLIIVASVCSVVGVALVVAGIIAFVKFRK